MRRTGSGNQKVRFGVMLGGTSSSKEVISFLIPDGIYRQKSQCFLFGIFHCRYLHLYIVNCINTTSGICDSMLVTVWFAGLDGVPSKPANLNVYTHTHTHRQAGRRLDGTPSKPENHTVTYIEWHIPEVVLIQLTLLMFHPNLHTTRSPTYSDIYQRSYWYNWLSWCSI